MAFVLTSFTILSTGITEEERIKTVDHLELTHNGVINTVRVLNDEQLNFKPTPETWSIAECIEHIAISENMIGGMLQGALQEPANAAMRDSVNMTDEQLLTMISNRNQKVKTSEAFEPSGKFGSLKETIEAFTAKRTEHIEYVKTTKDDLRNHYGKLPFATIDGLQILLFMSGHTQRHLKQIDEVIAHAEFPKSDIEPK